MTRRILVLLLASAFSLGASFSGQRGKPVAIAFPGAIGEAGYAVRGALGSATPPIGLPLGNLTDEADANCTGSGVSQVCERCDTTGNNVCSLREIFRYPNPRYMTCKPTVAGVIQLDGSHLRIDHDYLTADAAACSGPIFITNYNVAKAEGLRNVILRNFVIAAYSEHTLAERGSFTGCNTTYKYCGPASPDSATVPRTRTGTNAEDDSGRTGVCTQSAGNAAAGGCDDAGVGYGTCAYYDKAQWEPPATDCSYCDTFDHATGSTTGCSDTELNGGSSLDGLQDGSGSGIFDRLTVTRGCDEQVDIATYRSGYYARNTTVSNSVIAGGTDNNCHRDMYEGKGGNIDTPTGATAKGLREENWGITYARNIWALVSYRSPWITSGTGRDIASLRYQHRSTHGSGLSMRNQLPVNMDFLDDLFITGSADATSTWGSCSISGRFCASYEPCGGGEGSCSNDRYTSLSSTRVDEGHEGFGPVGRIYLDGNVIIKLDGNVQTPIATPEFDEQFDAFSVSYDLRPDRNPGGSGAPGDGVSNTFWDSKRSAPFRLVMPRVDAENDLEDDLLAHSGPAHDDPITQNILDTVAARGVRADLIADALWFPVYSGAAAWTDADADGLPDDRETTWCGGDCTPSSVSNVPPWRWWQRWVHRDAFGDTIPALTPTQCSDYVDNDAGGGTDLDDEDCEDTADNSEGSAAVACQLDNCPLDTGELQ